MSNWKRIRLDFGQFTAIAARRELVEALQALEAVGQAECALGTLLDDSTAVASASASALTATGSFAGELEAIGTAVCEAVSDCEVTSRYLSAFSTATVWPIPSAPSSEQPLIPVKRGPGRPTKMSDELKDEAQALKDAGGSDREAAMKLYGTPEPTLRQTKDAASLLSRHRKKRAGTVKGTVAPTE